MAKSKIVDHQLSGKEKYGIVRDHDRSIDSLTSTKDKRITNEIEKFVGQWPSIKDSENMDPLLRRTKQKKVKLTESDRKLKKLLNREIYLMHLYQRIASKKISKGKLYHLLNSIDKRLSDVRSQIELLKGSK